MVTPGVYEHFSGRMYKVIGIGLLEATEEPVVIYEAQYKNDLSKLWVRPVTDFEATVEIDGKQMPRFKRISDET